jgi:hypothetical protein
MRTSWTEAADFIKVTHFAPKTSSETDLPPGHSFTKNEKKKKKPISQNRREAHDTHKALTWTEIATTTDEDPRKS